MNTFTPERAPNETQEQYKARRLLAKSIVERMSLRGPHWPGINGSTARQQLRDNMRKSGAMSKRVRFADLLMANWAAKRREAMDKA